MSTLAPLVLALASAAQDAPPPIHLAASLEADALEVGSSYEVVLELDLGEGLSASGAGIPNPMLQLDVPPSMRLAGPYLRELEELRKNEFLHEPFERLVKERVTRIAFELVAAPDPDERLGLNVIGYVSAKEGERMSFLRRRLELELAPGAAAVEVDARNSRWGEDGALLKIGDAAPAFELPMADGVPLALEEFLGDQNIIVTTYRAFW